MAEATKKLLRIGIIDEETKQNVEERVIRSQGDITLGTSPDNTFVVKGSRYPKRVKLFEVLADGTYAVLFEKGQSGKIDVSGTPETLDQLAKRKGVEKKGTQFSLPVPFSVRGRVAVAGLVIRFQFIDVPVTLASPGSTAAAVGANHSQVDWPFVYIMAAAAILLGGTTTGNQVWWEVTGQYEYKPIEAGPQRLYELIRAEVQKPEEKKDEPEKPPEEPKEEDPTATTDAAPEEAPPAPEPEKKKAQAVKKAAQAKAKSSAGDRAKDRAKVAAAVRQKTFLHVLGSNSGGPGGELDTLRRGAHTAALDSAFDAAGGVTTDRNGAGGAFASSGPNAVEGEGDGSGKYKGLTADDTGGSRIATSQVKTENKADREVSIKANVGSGSVSGGEGTGQIDRGSVTAVFSRRKGAIKSCYERVLKTNPNVKGKVTIRFTIGPAGRITTIDVSGNTTGDTGLGQCIIDKVRAWRFDPPTGGSVTFSYPFLLDAK